VSTAKLPRSLRHQYIRFFGRTCLTLWKPPGATVQDPNKLPLLVVITQCVVQEILRLRRDVEEIRRWEVQFKFLRIGTEPDEKAAEFIPVKYLWQVRIALAPARILILSYSPG
jgi:hypothetical protein